MMMPNVEINQMASAQSPKRLFLTYWVLLVQELLFAFAKKTTRAQFWHTVSINQWLNECIFKGALYDIQSINIAANNYLLCKDMEE